MRGYSNEKSDSSGAESGEASPQRGPHAAMTAQRLQWWRRFNQLTHGTCADAHGRPDKAKLKAWQAEHGVNADGKVGPSTLAAARAEQAQEHKSEETTEAATEETAPLEEEHAAKPEHDAKPEKEAHSDDQVEQIADEITEHGTITEKIKKELEKGLTLAAVSRLKELLEERKAKQFLIDWVGMIEKERQEHKEAMPHGEPKHASTKGKASVLQGRNDEHSDGKEYVREGHGEKPHLYAPGHGGPQEHPGEKEMTRDYKLDKSSFVPSVQGSESRSGDAARTHHEDNEKKDEEEHKHHGFARRKLESLHGTVKEYKTDEHKEGAIPGTHAIEKKRHFGHKGGYEAEVHGKANEAKDSAGVKIGYGEGGLAVEGNANATVTLVEGGASIHTPPVSFSMGGENFRAELSFFVDASMLAELNGKIKVNVNVNEQGVEAEVGGFAGAKASVGAAGELFWMKRSPDDYAQRIVANGGAEKFLAGVINPVVAKMIPPSQYARLVGRVVPLLLGGEGDASVLSLSAKGEGTLGIGASASFSAKLKKGGRLKCHGKAGLTLGAGAGADVDLELALKEGLSLMAILDMMGEHHFENTLKPEKGAKEAMKAQGREMMHAIVEAVREAENDPEESFWVKQALHQLDPTLAAIDEAVTNARRKH